MTGPQVNFNPSIPQIILAAVLFLLGTIFGTSSARGRTAESHSAPPGYVLLTEVMHRELLLAAQDGGAGGARACTSRGDCSGFVGPFDDDVPGPGDLRQLSIASLTECAKSCSDDTRCVSFEFAPPQQDGFPNCHLNSNADAGGAQFRNFVLYVRESEVMSRRENPQFNEAIQGACEGVARPTTDYNPVFTAQADALRKRIHEADVPTYEQLYELIVNHPYPGDFAQSLFHTAPNPYKIEANFHFPFSNLHPPHVEKMLDIVTQSGDVRFGVEVGSFHGHSAITQSKVLDKRGLKDVPLLCIDPWIGDLGMLLFRDDWEKKLTPGELQDGRSTSYWQFLANIRSAVAEGLSPKHVVPLVTSSVVGARYLKALDLMPDFVYLDSAHEQDEVYMEIVLYYERLRPGGVLYGDDWSWGAVSHDVTRFCEEEGIEPMHLDAVTWAIVKPWEG